MEIAEIEMWYSRVSFELMLPLMHGFRHTHPHMSALEEQNNEFGLAQRELAIKSLKYYEEIIKGNKDTINTYKCKNIYACKGGIITNHSDNLCQEGHKGPLCDVCEKR